MKKLITLSIIILFIMTSFQSSVHAKGNSKQSHTTKSRELREIEEKSRYIRRKIEETREKEKIAIGKLTEIQRRLYITQDKLRRNKFKLSTTQNNLQQTEQKLVEVKEEYSGLKTDSADRIRQIYQGQRLKILEILLNTPNLTDFLDTLYYQKLLVAQDKSLIEKLFNQSKEIEVYKDRLAIQKIKIAHIVGEIEDQKKEIGKEHSSQTNLVNKLRTERATYEQAERQLERDSQQLIAEINRLVGNNIFSGQGGHGSGAFSYPLHGRLTSPFGFRRHPIFKVVSFHSGVDLAAPYGTPVMASDSGRVIFNGWYGGYGKVVIVDHGMNYSTLYAHLSKTRASRGENISKGEVVGFEGQTGYSTGPHVHFEVRKNGRPQNPLNYLR